MKLYYTPGTCSLAPHIILKETNTPFTAVKTDIRAKKVEDGSDFFKVNPNGYVPALMLDDGTVLTEASVIMQYIADKAGATQPCARKRHPCALSADVVAELCGDRGPQGLRADVQSEDARGGQGRRSPSAFWIASSSWTGTSASHATSPATVSRFPTRISSRSCSGRAVSRSISPHSRTSSRIWNKFARGPRSRPPCARKGW